MKIIIVVTAENIIYLYKFFSEILPILRFPSIKRKDELQKYLINKDGWPENRNAWKSASFLFHEMVRDWLPDPETDRIPLKNIVGCDNNTVTQLEADKEDVSDLYEILSELVYILHKDSMYRERDLERFLPEKKEWRYNERLWA